MARQQIDKATVRRRMAPRREPYWGTPVERGLYVGFRKLDGGWGTWVARWRDDEGKQRYHSLGPVTETMDYDAARKAAREWMKGAAAGVDTSAVRTVADACREYVIDRKKQKGEATGHDADLRFKRTIYRHPLGAVQLSKITQKRIEDWRDELGEPDDDDKALSKASLNRTLTALKAALNYAVSRRYVSPEKALEWRLVKPYEANNRRDLFLDLAQRRALLQNASGGIKDLIEAVMLTGARAGELTKATRRQFDHRTGSMTFDGKTGARTVPLSPDAVALFTRLAKSKLPNARLFTRDDGKSWGPSDWDKLVRDAATAAKLPAGVCLYTLRHSFITEAITGGLSPLEVARLVGTSLAMIDKHYGHLVQSAARERLAQVAFV